MCAVVAAMPAQHPWTVPFPQRSTALTDGCQAAAEAVSASVALFDLDEALTSSGTCAAPPVELMTMLRVEAASLSSPSTRAEAQLLEDLRFCKAMVLRECGRCDVATVAAKLAVCGYRVAVRTALGGGQGQDCFQHLHHVLLMVTPPEGGPALIADPSFRSSFQLSEMHTTSAYAAALPTAEEFVGSEARLAALVKFLCSEMAAAFCAAGRSVPPWRAEASMLSKWLPSRFRDAVMRPDVLEQAAKAAERAAAAAAVDADGAGNGSQQAHTGGANSGSGGSASEAALDSSCSPMSPLELGGGSRQQVSSSKLPTAAANSAQRPLAVQTGFALPPQGASLLSRELGSQAKAQQQQQQQQCKASATGSSTVKRGGSGNQMKRVISNKSVRFAAEAIAAARDEGSPSSRRGGKVPAAFNVWADSNAKGKAAASGAADDGLPAIRTVKMTGRCR